MELLKIDIELAKRAYYNISFDPEKRGESTAKDFDNMLQSDYDEFAELAQSEPQKEVLRTEFEQYQQKFKSKFEAYLHAKSQTASPMITGPARFPVERNHKRIRSEDKRYQEFSQFRNKAGRAIKRKIKDAQTPAQAEKAQEKKETTYMEYLLKESMDTIKCMTGELPYDTQSIKQALERRIMNFARMNPEMAEKITNEINLLGQEKAGKDVFTKRHKIWQNIADIKTEKATPYQPKENETLFKNDFFEVVNNHNKERVQILFDGKPELEVRNNLKYHGFKWAPSQMAWQRKNTPNGIFNAKLVIEHLTKEKESA